MALRLPLPIAGQSGQAQPVLAAELNTAQPAAFVFGHQLRGFRATPAPPHFHYLCLFVHPSTAPPTPPREQMGWSNAYYVTAIRPSYQQTLLAEAADHLEEITLSTGAVVRAWRTQREIAGQQRDAVVVFSPQLFEGQVRGLHQHLARCGEQLQELGLAPRGTPEAVRRKLAQICGRQYLRTVVRYEVQSNEQGVTAVRSWSDLEEYRRLHQHYFGLRVLITDRSEWTTAQIVEAYRGQSRVEAAFRDLKDPGMLSTRPQFHWTDQKLQVHAFMCVTAYLLVRLLWWRARRDANFAGGARNLLAQLARIRQCRIVEHTGRAGRPRVRQQIEEVDAELENLGRTLRALPLPN